MSNSKTRTIIWRRFVGSMIPNWLLSRPEISPGAKLIYARLAQFAGRKRYCFPTQETLGRKVGMKDRQVRRHLRTLQLLKLIDVDHRGRTTSNRYYFLEHPWMSENGKNAERPEMTDQNGQKCPDKEDISDRSERPETSDRRESAKENQAKRESTKRSARTEFIPPTVEQCEMFAKNIGMDGSEGSNFFNHYTATGWIMGKTPMKDWQAAMRQWKSRQPQFVSKTKQSERYDPHI